MGSVFILISKVLLVYGFSFSNRFDSIGIFYIVGCFLVVTAVVLIVFVLFVALRQCIYNYKVKRSYEYKIKKMLSDIVGDAMKK